MLDDLSIPVKNTISNNISDVHNNINIFPDNFERSFLERRHFSVSNKEVYREPCETSEVGLFAKGING